MQTMQEVAELLTDMIRKIAKLERRLDALQIPEVYWPISTADVSSPPTDAELDAEFGTPATIGAGFCALIDDNDADTTFHLVATTSTSWVHAVMTKAV